ncbi:hypothetical protein ES703_22184 [subsurface metagenome]
MPAIPPPTTTRSNWPASSGSSGSPSIFRRKVAIRSPLFGGAGSVSAVKTIASHRPSKPVRSCRATVTCLFVISIVPPSCQCHFAPLVPKMVPRGTPSMSSWNLPGAVGAFHGATQLRVRTHRRYLPAAGNPTFVVASLTGSPKP